jgi:hypothetical protein
MLKERIVIEVEGRKITDTRTPNPGYDEADIFFSPVDVLTKGKQIIGKIGYSDQRSNTTYSENLANLVKRTPGKRLRIKTIPIDEAHKLGLVVKPVSIDLTPPLKSN